MITESEKFLNQIEKEKLDLTNLKNDFNDLESFLEIYELLKGNLDKLQEMKETDRVLCIDFGTSNTTAGSYRIKDEYGSVPELVVFADVTQNNQFVGYFPTVVYVENAEDEENIIYQK